MTSRHVHQRQYALFSLHELFYLCVSCHARYIVIDCIRTFVHIYIGIYTYIYIYLFIFMYIYVLHNLYKYTSTCLLTLTIFSSCTYQQQV